MTACSASRELVNKHPGGPLPVATVIDRDGEQEGYNTEPGDIEWPRGCDPDQRPIAGIVGAGLLDVTV
jgi:hypothetical protein